MYIIPVKMKKVRVSLRIDEDDYNKIKKKAEDEKRTINSYINYRLSKEQEAQH